MTAGTAEDDALVPAIWTALSRVVDPELAMDVVTLGLVYDVQVEDRTARITFTLTTRGCPMQRIITDGIEAAVAQVDGVERVETRVVWSPAWDPGMIAPGALPR